MGTGLARRAKSEGQGDDVDPRRVRLQLRIVRVALQSARPAERDGMMPRAMEILDKMAFEIESHPDPALTQLLAEVRSEAEGKRD
jgi:hypothetical protein